MTTIAAILAACIIGIILIVVYITKYSNEAMDQIMPVDSAKKWIKHEAADGNIYWMPKEYSVKVKSTIKRP